MVYDILLRKGNEIKTCLINAGSFKQAIKKAEKQTKLKVLIITEMNN
jgi:fatty acid-binding protein DegV